VGKPDFPYEPSGKKKEMNGKKTHHQLWDYKEGGIGRAERQGGKRGDVKEGRAGSAVQLIG